MKKLSLRLDDIQVTSFQTLAAESGGAGTVQGAEMITRFTYCVGDETCWQTCAATCDPGLC